MTGITHFIANESNIAFQKLFHVRGLQSWTRFGDCQLWGNRILFADTIGPTITLFKDPISPAFAAEHV